LNRSEESSADTYMAAPSFGDLTTAADTVLLWYIAKPCEYVGRPVRQQDDPRCCNDTALGGLSVADAFEPAVTRSGGERDPLTAQTARRNIPQARTFE
jgi:hypothetical protein